jgi:hypothetical protein
MVGRAGGLATIAVSPQVGNDDGEVLGEPRSDSVPHYVRLGYAMQEQKRGTAATATPVDHGLRDLEIELMEPFKHAVSPLRGQEGYAPNDQAVYPLRSGYNG